MKTSYLYIALIFTFFCISCKKKDEKPAYFDFFLSDNAFIINKEANNSILGTPLKVASINANCIVSNELSQLNSEKINPHQYLIGWGNKLPYFDAGYENLAEIDSLNFKSGCIYIGKKVRGDGLPENGSAFVLWNKNFSGFKKNQNHPKLTSSLFNGFVGNSMQFAGPVFNSTLNQFELFIQECDQPASGIYMATSIDGENWTVANKGNAILKNMELVNNPFFSYDAKGKCYQMPSVSSVVLKNGYYFFFLDGYDNKGSRSIGLMVSKKLNKDFHLISKPIVKPLPQDKAVFYPKITSAPNGYVMAYASRSFFGKERVSLATSKDLITWSDLNNNAIENHKGWRSAAFCSEPAGIFYKNDHLYLLVVGAKAYQTGWLHHYVLNDMYKGNSGNVNDQAMGVFRSSDNGKSFVAHSNNPVFCADYTSVFENDHLGGNFAYYSKNNQEFLLYQAKALYNNAYGIFLRKRKTADSN